MHRHPPVLSEIDDIQQGQHRYSIGDIEFCRDVVSHRGLVTRSEPVNKRLSRHKSASNDPVDTALLASYDRGPHRRVIGVVFHSPTLEVDELVGERHLSLDPQQLTIYQNDRPRSVREHNRSAGITRKFDQLEQCVSSVS